MILGGRSVDRTAEYPGWGGGDAGLGGVAGVQLSSGLH